MNDNRRKFTGGEIAELFNNTEVLDLEKRQTEIEAELDETQRQLASSDDWEQQDELRGRISDLREALARILAQKRMAQKKFS